MTFFWSGCPEWMLTIVVAAPNGWAATAETAPAAAIKAVVDLVSRGGSGEASCADVDEHQKLPIGLAVKTSCRTTGTMRRVIPAAAPLQERFRSSSYPPAGA